MTYEKVTVHSKTGHFIASFNNLFTSLADVRRHVKNRVSYSGIVQVTAYPEAGYPPKTFNLKTK